MADVSLATFYLFDKENVGSDMQLAAVVVRRGYRGCRRLPRLPWLRRAWLRWLRGLRRLLRKLGTLPLVLSSTT